MSTRTLLNPIFDKHRVPEARRDALTTYLTTYGPKPAGLSKYGPEHPCVRECLRAMSDQFLKDVRDASTRSRLRRQ